MAELWTPPGADVCAEFLEAESTFILFKEVFFFLQ